MLELGRQLKIPLMSISSLDDSQPSGVMGQAQNIQGSSDTGLLRSSSTATARTRAADASSHSRGNSLSGLIAGGMRKQERKPDEADDSVFQDPEAPGPSTSPVPPGETSSGTNTSGADKPLPASPEAFSVSPAPRPAPVFLKPHIVSPSAEEFLLVTGTGLQDPGIGIFVNLDGDPTRPTLEFERYPADIVVDGGSADLSASAASPEVKGEEGYVIASMAKDFEDGTHYGLEIQRWDINLGEEEHTRHWLEVRSGESEGSERPASASFPGIRLLLGSIEATFQEVVERLCQRRFSPFAPETPEASTATLRRIDSRAALTALSMERQSKEKELFERDDEDSPLPGGWLDTRNAEEEDFASRLAGTASRVAVWSGNHIWWALRNPLLLRLEAGMDERAAEAHTFSWTAEERRELLTILNSFRGQVAKNELEFVTFRYIRQRAGALLFTAFLHSADAPFAEKELKATEEALLDGALDPRVVLGLIPALRNEIIVTRKGIWIYGGVKGTVERYIASDRCEQVGQTVGALSPAVINFLRRFLAAWRRNKGFGSVADESQVFRTVDAALLLVLLELDQEIPKGMAGLRAGSVRAELYELVDKGVDCFDRAVDLLESYRRLFVLSRLYQSRKMAADVLATWKRIIEGEEDAGGELRDGEQRVRDYLSKIGNQALVHEYGIWLANRNPRLGVQVFADDKARAAKFEPTQVVAMLRQEAPDAVKYYLEHLVFGKGHTGYVNELVTYYLDIVIEDLQSNAASREAVVATYAAYRALRPPKPTYRQFLTDNAPPDDEAWQSRLRLLQLLGGAHDYDAAAIAKRIALLPADQDQGQLLVPEAIILDGREHRHEDALRLLVHRLGDYDTAVSYCLRGGASPYTPVAGGASQRGRHDGDGDGVSADRAAQARLFRALLGEFLVLEDVSDRVEQTGALLERFGAWFDVQEVLGLIPDGWSVDVAAGFLVGALRRLVMERHETAMARALSSAENLKVSYDLLTRIDEKGPVVEAET